MSRRLWILLILTVLFLLHNDFWLWRQPQLVLGLPAGLLYQLAYCILISIVMGLIVRFAWPKT